MSRNLVKRGLVTSEREVREKSGVERTLPKGLVSGSTRQGGRVADQERTSRPGLWSRE